MWINPKYRDQVEQPRPPAENGRRLATFPRGDGAEMRVNLSTFEGKPFISLRVWERGQDGAWWPVKGKGCSVRMNEAGELAEVLAAVASGRAPDAHPPPRDEAPKFVDKGRAARAPWDAQKLAPSGPTEDRGEFNEF